jgi:uncharacterized protein YukE
VSDENAYERDHPYDNPWYHNHYQEQTGLNTGTEWLHDQEPVDVDPDGLTGYAKNMTTVQTNLNTHLSDLSLLASTPTKAWEGHVLGEAAYARAQLTSNYTELMNYLSHLSTALMNIGMAAQTVADAYSGTDGQSAASLDAVRFAFGDPDAARPAGLPPGLGKTYLEAYIERLREGTGEAVDPHSPVWGDSGSWHERTNGDGSVTQVAYGPGGQRMEVTTVTIPGGLGTVTTTVVYAANGAVLSRTTEQKSSYLSGQSVITSTVTSDATGPTGSTRETTTYGEDGQPVYERTAEYDSQGNETTATTTETGSDGSQTLTTTRDGEVVQQVAVGAQTPGSVTAPSSPAAEALDRITDD